MAEPQSHKHARQVAGLILGTSLSVLCLVLVFRGVQVQDVLQTLRQTSPGYAMLAILSYALSIWAKARRWRLLFYPQHARLRLHKLASVILIGQMVNVWLLARAGELTRAYLIGRIEGVSKPRAFGTVILEKSLESLTLLLSVALLAFLMPLPAWLKTSGILLSIALVAILAVLFIIANRKEGFLALAERLLSRVPRLNRLGLPPRLRAVSDSLELLRRMDVNLGLFVWSAFVWVLAAMTNECALRASGVAVPWYASFFLLVVFYIGAALPASPGRLGVFHYLAVISLAIFGVERDQALSFAILLHAIAYVLMGMAGALCLWQENYALQREMTAQETPKVNEG